MELGFDPSTFWSLTPKELKVCFDGAMRRLEREHNERAWLVWHVAALPRMKRLPRLEALLAKPRKKRAPQTWQEQQETAKMIAAMYGGQIH